MYEPSKNLQISQFQRTSDILKIKLEIRVMINTREKKGIPLRNLSDTNYKFPGIGAVRVDGEPGRLA